MGILSNFFSRKPEQPPTQLVIHTDATPTVVKDVQTPPGTLWWSLGGMVSDTGIPVTPVTATQAATVYASLKVLSEDVAKLPIQVRKHNSGGGWTNDRKHPVAKLLRRPNEWQTGFEFWAYLVLCQQLKGNGYAIIIRDRDANPIELIAVIPDRVTCVMDWGGKVYYRITTPQIEHAETVVFDNMDVLHIRNMSLDTGLTGTSVINHAQNVIGVRLAQQKNEATLYKQGSMIKGVLSTPEGVKLDKPTSDRMASSWSSAYTGSDNAHRVAVLEDGTKFQSISQTAEESQLVENSKHSNEEIASLFRMQQHKVGILDHATFTNIENMNQQYIDDTLMGICCRIEQALERTLLFDDERDDYEIKFDFSQLLRGDEKSRAEAAQIWAMNGILNQNEIREREGRGPIPGGEVYRVPANALPVSVANNPNHPPTMAPAPTGSSPAVKPED